VDRPSSTIEDYIVTIYRLGVGGGPVLGTQLAEQLGVAPASVTEMVARLRAASLVTPARRIQLSEVGLGMARTLVSRHRLAERFLVDVLGFGWEDVHEEAHRLEHAMSPRMTERLAAFLGHPQTCPHGHPIMEGGAVEPDLALVPLGSLRAGEEGVVRRIAHEDHELLAMLTRLGIRLGSRVRRQAAGVEVDGEDRAVPEAVAGEVLVEQA
jgi:DtxR family transcriptional regulator, Mn-dependent transcriptional regulator